MKSHLNSRRRFLLFGVLPVSLAMIAAPLSPYLAPEINVALHSINNRQAAVYPSLSPVPAVANDENAPRISPSVELGLQKGRRMVALDVISRLEEEARRQGGHTRLSPLDLKRLRNALRQSESAALSNADADLAR